MRNGGWCRKQEIMARTYPVPQLCRGGKLYTELCRLDLSPRNPLSETVSPTPTVCMDCPTKGAQEEHGAGLSEIDVTTMTAMLVRCAEERILRLPSTNLRERQR